MIARFRTTFCLLFLVGLAQVAVGVGQGCGADEPRLPTPVIEWADKDHFKDNNHPHDPLVLKDKVIVGTDKGDLIAFDCKDGVAIGTRHYGGRIFHHMSTDGARLYFTSAEGVRCADSDNGSLIWNLDLPHCDGPILASAKQELVYVGWNDGHLYAFDARSGKERWRSDFLADAPPEPPKFAGKRARVGLSSARPSGLAIDGDMLFLSVFDQSRVVAINAKNGKRLWSFQTGGWIFGSAVASDKHVFIGSQDDKFYCLEKRTGQKVWSFQTKGRIESGGTLDAQSVYFGSCDGHVYCLDQADGKERWRFGADKQNGRNTAIYSVPVLLKGSVYFAAGEGQVYALNQKSGKLQWKIRPSNQSEIYCSLATDEKALYLVTRPGNKGGEASLVAIGMK
ncbi:hypothetical protein BH10PLA2_BH10PLA2_26400 [soil metagenome]